MKKIAGFALLLSTSTLLACGSDPPPPANSPEPTSATTAPVADMPAPAETAKAPPPAEVFNFGKKAPAAGAKLTDKVTIEAKDDKRVEERKVEVVASEDKAITKEKVTLTAFDLTLKGKSTTPNKALYGKALIVEPGKDAATVTNEAGKPASAADKLVATRRGPHVGEPLPGVLAFSERPLKVGDVVEGERLGMFVAELGEWKDESLKAPATVKRDFSGSKATLKSVDGGTATFDVDVKEKTTDAAGQFSLEVEYTGTVVVKVSDSLASKADLKTKGALKIKDMPGAGGKKINADVPIEQTISFERKWE